MPNELELLRTSTAVSINSNPFIIQNAKIKTTIQNEYEVDIDGDMQDFAGPITVQLCKSNSNIPQEQGECTPGTIQESYYLLAEYTVNVPEGLRFIYSNDKKFITKKPEKVIMGGGHAYNRVPLEELNNE